MRRVFRLIASAFDIEDQSITVQVNLSEKESCVYVRRAILGINGQLNFWMKVMWTRE